MTEPAEESPRESQLWRFSLALYALPDVAPACLVLQDEAGVDVNLLLFLLFLATSRRQAAPEDVARLDQTVRAWREEVVKSLRALRRGLKTGIGDVPPASSENFRAMIKRVELEAERLEQRRLEEAGASMSFATAASREAAARVNIATYGRFLGLALPEASVATVLKGFQASAG